MATLSMDLLRQVQWSQGYLWDFKIVDKPFGGLVQDDDPSLKLPKPFDQWFPAQDVEDPVSEIDSYTIEGAQDTFKIPRASAQRILKVTFVDDADHQLLSFFENWMQATVLNDGLSVATLKESVKLIQVVKLDSQRQIIAPLVKTYWVYPEGTLVFHGSGDGNAMSYTISLVKVGRGIV